MFRTHQANLQAFTPSENTVNQQDRRMLSTPHPHLSTAREGVKLHFFKLDFMVAEVEAGSCFGCP